jgi:hypothetical protein
LLKPTNNSRSNTTKKNLTQMLPPTDSEFSLPTTLKSTATNPQATHSPSTNSLTWPPLNSKPATSDYYQPKQKPLNSNTSPLDLPQLQLIGPQRETSLPSKTKDNVDHAGLSPQPDHWNLALPSSEKDSETSLNNNWLTAHRAKETWDATED